MISNAQQPALVQLDAHPMQPVPALDAAVQAMLQAGISVVAGAGNQHSGTPLLLASLSKGFSDPFAVATTLPQCQSFRSSTLVDFMTNLLHCQQVQ